MNLNKKFGYGLLLAAGISIGANQTTRAQSLELGIKAGASFNQTKGNSLDEGFKGSFLGGAYGGVRVAMLKIQIEALFSQSTVTTGTSFKDAFNKYLTEKGQDLKDGTFKMNELSIPLTVGIRVVPKLLWAEVGVQYTGVVSIKDKDSFLKESEDVFKNGYVSGIVGASVDLPFKLNAGARYLFGLSDRNNADVGEKWKTSQIQLHVGYSFLR